MAERLRIGAVDKSVYKAPKEFAALRELARVHGMLVSDVVRVQLRLKSVYRSRAIRVAGKAVYGVKSRAQYESQLPAALRRATSKLYTHYDLLLDLKKQAESELIAESKRYPITHVLQTAPGLGPIRVSRLLPIVITPHRFRTKRQFWSYCGLGIVMRSSSDWIRTDAGQWQRAQVAKTRGLSRQHNHVLKDTFKGAATSVIMQGARVPIYTEYERLLEAGTKPNLAKLALARKIAAIVLRMLSSRAGEAAKIENVYRPGRSRDKTKAEQLVH